MKKSLIALAVLAASGAAMAQSSVTLYGIADVWFGSTKTKLSGEDTDGSSLRQTQLNSGGVNESRWGLMGSEDLGGGLKANFLLEQGFTLDNGAGGSSSTASTGAFSRYAYVGVSGGFGAVKLGKVATAYDDIRGTNNNVFDSAFSATPWVGYTATGNNTIAYTLPTMGGFTGGISYSLGEDKTTGTSAGNVLALNVMYAQGPFNVGYAYQKEKTGDLTTLGAVAGINADLIAAGANPDPLAGDIIVTGAGATAKYNLLTGSYDFGAAKLVASYNKADFNFGPGDDAEAKEYQIGVNVPLSSSLTLAAGYGRSEASAEVDLYTAKAYSAALTYTLSKRTMVYAGMKQQKTTFDAAIADAQIKTTLYAVGVNHKF